MKSLLPAAALLLAVACRMDLYNSADPTTEAYVETQLLRCLVNGNCLPPPPRLGPVCTMCYLYVTQNGYAPVTNFSSPAQADPLCDSDPWKPSTGHYKAVLVDGATRRASVTANAGDGQLDWVLFPNTSYYRASDNALIMTTNAQGIFVYGTATNFINTTALLYWTGFAIDWTTGPAPATDHCTGWTSSSGVQNGMRGGAAAGNSTVLASSTAPCNGAQQLLCAEQ